MVNRNIIKVKNQDERVLNIKSECFVDIQKVKFENKFLPYVCFQREKENKNFLKLIEKNADMDEKETILEDLSIIHICTREAIRKLEGQKYTERYLKSLDPEKLKIFGEKAKEAKDDKTLQIGFIHLIIVMYNGFVKICTLEAFGSLSSYFIRALKVGDLKDKRKVILMLNDHSVNMKLSKNGEYFVGWKFNQFSSAMLTMQEIEEIKECYQKDKKKVELFLTK